MAGRPRAAMIALVVLATACSRRDPISSCDHSLAGPWRSDHEGEQWMIVESSGALEAYPLFRDGRPPGTPAELETAPRAIDLARTPSGLVGDVKRRYMRRDVVCTATAGARVTACANDVLELVLADPPVPADFEPCAFARPDASRRERWHRE